MTKQELIRALEAISDSAYTMGAGKYVEHAYTPSIMISHLLTKLIPLLPEAK